jgi:hypothetical protein
VETELGFDVENAEAAMPWQESSAMEERLRILARLAEGRRQCGGAVNARLLPRMV